MRPSPIRGLLPLLLVALLGACDETTAPPGPLPPLEAGGSNYVMYSIGDYLRAPTEANWYRPGVLRPTIAAYHLDSLTVHDQLRAMRENGQRNIALVLWYEDFSLHPDRAGVELYGHIADASAGALHPQHARNLEGILRAIERAGFAEINFRFASQGLSRPQNWAAWSGSRYETNRRFIWSTKAIVDRVVADGPARVIYDLDVELGGIHHLGEGRRYAQQLWKDYVRAFGSRGTVGFSIPVGPGVVATALKDFDSAGSRPEFLAVDLYNDEYRSLQYVSREMRRAGARNLHVIVQEVFYNDSTAASAVHRARDELKLPIRYVMQWPLERGSSHPHFSVDFPVEYGAYR